MNKNLYLLLLGTLMSAACTNNLEDINIDHSNKTAISFSVEESHTPMTRAGFTASTKIAMRIKSEDGSGSTRYTRTVANAAAAATGKDYSAITVDGSLDRKSVV